MLCRGLLILAIFACLACANSTPYVKQIGDFREATQVTAAAVRPALTSLNVVEREFELLESLALNSDLDRSFLTPTFSPEGIRVRLSAFQLIDIYTRRLADIASADTGEQITAADETLQQTINSLGESIAAINANVGEDIGQYSGPLTSSFGFIASLWLNQKREVAIERAVTTAAPEIDKLLALLENDLERAHQARLEVAFETVSQAVEKYNASALKDRRANGMSALAAANAYEQLSTLDPTRVIRSMRKAHASLLKVVNEQNDVNFSTLATDLRIFSVSANEAFAVYSSFNSANQ